LRYVHHRVRAWRNYRRYGVNSAYMFENVELEINSMCNRSCSYCPNVSAKRPYGYMDESLFHKIIADLQSMDFDGVVSYHFYGEPMLDKRLPDFVEYTSRHLPKSKSVIYSNGDFLTLELFRQYIQSGLGAFWITQHDNCVPPNLQRILDEATAEEKKHIDVHLANDIRLVNRSGLIATLKPVKSALTMPCDWPLYTMVITQSGNVVPCCNDYFETEVVGNVKTHSLREVWCGASYERFRRALSRGDRQAYGLCAACDYTPPQSSLLRIVPM
jgi:radical SAM protein with 4Fe4S-binding SPASM domain